MMYVLLVHQDILHIQCNHCSNTLDLARKRILFISIIVAQGESHHHMENHINLRVHQKGVPTKLLVQILAGNTLSRSRIRGTATCLHLSPAYSIRHVMQSEFLHHLVITIYPDLGQQPQM